MWWEWIDALLDAVFCAILLVVLMMAFAMLRV